MAVQYKFLGPKVWTHKIHELSKDRTGLFKGSVTYMTNPENYVQAIPVHLAPHPVFPFMNMEDYTLSTSGAFVSVTCNYYGAEGINLPGGTDPVYELSNGAREAPIESHPKFDEILSRSNLTESDVLDEDGLFKGFPKRAGPIFGVESYLDFGQVVWRKMWNTASLPSAGLSQVGKKDDPDGPKPSFAGRDWILITNAYTRKGRAYQRTMEWKLSGPKGADPLIYG